MAKRLLKVVCGLFVCKMILKVWKGRIKMVDMYIALVMAEKRTCNPENKKVPLVPARYRQQVLEELEAIGLDADGNPIVAA